MEASDWIIISALLPAKNPRDSGSANVLVRHRAKSNIVFMMCNALYCGVLGNERG